MGRGRAKAKQAKVARALKYDTGSTDLSALQAELAGARGSQTSGSAVDDDLEGDYSAWIEDDEDDEEAEEAEEA